MLDAGVWAVTAHAPTTVTLQSASDPRTGLQIERTFAMAGAGLEERIALTNESERTTRWSPWQRGGGVHCARGSGATMGGGPGVLTGPRSTGRDRRGSPGGGIRAVRPQVRQRVPELPGDPSLSLVP